MWSVGQQPLHALRCSLGPYGYLIYWIISSMIDPSAADEPSVAAEQEETGRSSLFRSQKKKQLVYKVNRIF